MNKSTSVILIGLLTTTILCSSTCQVEEKQTPTNTKTVQNKAPTTPIPLKKKSIHQLSKSHITILKALGYPIVVPGYLPRGFKIESVKGEDVPLDVPGGGAQYTLKYGDGQGGQFSISGGVSGFGGVGCHMGDDWSSKEVKTKQFGTLNMCYTYSKNEFSSEDTFGTEPYKEGDMQYGFEAKGISRLEAIEVFTNLDFLD